MVVGRDSGHAEQALAVRRLPPVLQRALVGEEGFALQEEQREGRQADIGHAVGHVAAPLIGKGRAGRANALQKGLEHLHADLNHTSGRSETHLQINHLELLIAGSAPPRRGDHAPGENAAVRPAMLSRRGCCLGLLSVGIGSTVGRPALSKEEILAIDCHAHVFACDLPLTSDRRYAPAYDATLSDYLGMLDRNGMSHGVLVQPSFLGTDNAYLLEALRREPRRLRGIAVAAPETEPDELRRFDKAGIVGLRLNLI